MSLRIFPKTQVKDFITATMDANKRWVLVESTQIGQLNREGDCVIGGQAERKKLCIVRHAGKLYALDNRCPHAGGPLSGGFVNEKQEIVCPWHRFSFDLNTGQSESGGYYVNVYPIEQKGAQFWVGLPKKKRWWF